MSKDGIIFQPPGIKETYLHSQSPLSYSSIAELSKRIPRTASTIQPNSKYFAELHRTAEYCQLLEELRGMHLHILSNGVIHVQTLEEISVLFTRWYANGERDEELKDQIKQHVISRQAPAELEHKNYPLSFITTHQPTEESQNSLLIEAQHATGCFGLVYMSSVDSIQQFPFNPAKFLGMHARAIDFLHYTHPLDRSTATFTTSDVRRIISLTEQLAEAILERTSAASEYALFQRETEALESIRSNLFEIVDESSVFAEARQTAEQIFTSCHQAKQVEEDFLTYVFGLISAVKHTFTCECIL